MLQTPTLTPTANAVLSGLDALAGVAASALTGAEQADLLRVLARIESQVCAIKMTVLAAAEKKNTAAASGAASTGQWAAKVGNADQRSAHRDAGLAVGLDERPATK